MDIGHALILGIVEGITEYLPISSTGHLILTAHVLKLPQTEFLKSFEISIQVGAILAVVSLYWRKLFLNSAVFKRVIIAFIPTAIVGLVFYPLVKTYLLGNSAVTLWALLVGGVLLIAFEYWYRERPEAVRDIAHMPYLTSFGIGVFQAFAIIPGVSRAGATIVGGMLFGVERTRIVEFSFLLAIPTLVAATGFDLVKNTDVLSATNVNLLLVGFLTSYVVALVSIRAFVGFIQRHSFIPFGIYRIALALVFFLVL